MGDCTTHAYPSSYCKSLPDDAKADVYDETGTYTGCTGSAVTTSSNTANDDDDDDDDDLPLWVYVFVPCWVLAFVFCIAAVRHGRATKKKLEGAKVIPGEQDGLAVPAPEKDSAAGVVVEQSEKSLESGDATKFPASAEDYSSSPGNLTTLPTASLVSAVSPPWHD